MSNQAEQGVAQFFSADNFWVVKRSLTGHVKCLLLFPRWWWPRAKEVWQ